MRLARLRRVLRGHIERATLAFAAIRQVEMRTMPLRRIAIAGTALVPTLPGGLRDPTLHHDPGELKQLAEEALLTHILIVSILNGSQEKNSRSERFGTQSLPWVASIQLRVYHFCAGK